MGPLEMTHQEKCEWILRCIYDAVKTGRKVTISITEEEEWNSDRWFVIESPHYLCLSASAFGDFESTVADLAREVKKV